VTVKVTAIATVIKTAPVTVTPNAAFKATATTTFFVSS
jgi:hypothetical protein